MNDKIYRVNMTDRTFQVEEVPTEWAGLGGRALTSTIIGAEVDPECHPLGPNNKLVFAPGLLSGTPASNSGRNSCGTKSPLTGGIKESNVGGTSAQIFAKLGIKALIIEGMPAEDEPFYHLHITKEKVEFIPVPHLQGKDNFEILDIMSESYGKKAAVMSIGRPGEMRMLVANISVKDPKGKLRSHGRGAMGAVMGSKKIKVITVDPEKHKDVHIADPMKLKKANRTFTEALKSDPISGEALPRYGTDVLVNIMNEAGAFPTRNFRSGQCEFAEVLSGERMYETIVERNGDTTHGCHAGCVMQCSQTYNDKEGKEVTSGFEYETIWSFGAHTGIQNLDLIARLDHLMDDLGVDSIETGIAMGVAVDAGLLVYGDGQRALELIRDEMANGTPLGRIIGAGAAEIGRLYGLVRVPVVKNQGITAYEPRAVKGQGVSFATNTMGGDHTTGYAVANNIMHIGGHIDPHTKEGQVELSRQLQIITAAIDSTGMCLFIAFPLSENPDTLSSLIEMISAKLGVELDYSNFEELGIKTLKVEREFNKKAGLTNAHDRLPEFMKYEPLPPHNVVWDFTGEELDALWDFIDNPEKR